MQLLWYTSLPITAKCTISISRSQWAKGRRKKWQPIIRISVWRNITTKIFYSRRKRKDSISKEARTSWQAMERVLGKHTIWAGSRQANCHFCWWMLTISKSNLTHRFWIRRSHRSWFRKRIPVQWVRIGLIWPQMLSRSDLCIVLRMISSHFSLSPPDIYYCNRPMHYHRHF